MSFQKRLIAAASFLFLLAGLPAVHAEEASGSYSAQTFSYLEENAPETQSQYLYLFDAGNGQELLNRNGNEKMYPASMTKLMTAILAIENLPDLNEQIAITNRDWEGLLERNASVTGFYPGAVATVEDLLYGTLLPSGAEACNALAYRVSGSIDSFTALMNEKAAELGMNSTHFANPTGLHEEDHYSSCHDIALLLAYCMQNETFRTIDSARSYTAGNGLSFTSTLWDGIEKADDYDFAGLQGGKTGYTDAAGRCLASASSMNGMNLILVTGKAEEADGNIKDAAEIYRWYEKHYTRSLLARQGDIISTCRILDTIPSRTFTDEIHENVEMDIPVNSTIEIRDNLDPNGLASPIEAGEKLGAYTIKVNDQLVYQRDILSSQNYKHSYLASFARHYKLLWKNKPAYASLYHALLIITIILIRSSHRKRPA